MTAFDKTFKAAIPGMSLSHKLGDLPHEQPPQYTDPNEFLEYIWKQLHQKETLKMIWHIAEQGGTVWAISRAIVYKAAMQGIIQINLGVVVMPTVQKMLITLIKSKGIEPKLAPKFRSKTKDMMSMDAAKGLMQEAEKNKKMRDQQQTQKIIAKVPQDNKAKSLLDQFQNGVNVNG